MKERKAKGSEEQTALQLSVPEVQQKTSPHPNIIFMGLMILKIHPTICHANQLMPMEAKLLAPLSYRGGKNYIPYNVVVELYLAKLLN